MGAVTSFSRKQELSAMTLTEAEFIGIDDALPQILWMRYFMECQGCKVNENIIFQDNKSALTLEKNGKASISKRKKIKVKYFLQKTKLTKER